ncbi:DUF6343 family protein [Kineosporia babensis]|uniref:DUF6343 family protein n=1 Tax=Kineosporia babensis TaxID=499548 RepID=A0A9X1NA27_9ACTN|nr:DUF6343 family protein [Kineosporia babensis]MCD5310079.1 DUF6343 family protein [Kineosporia babensis]
MAAIRSGDEPGTARSPLRLRLVLALFGLVFSVFAVGLLAGRAPLGYVLLFAVMGLTAAVDVGVVLRHLRQGPHFQPGSQIPPYRAVNPDPVPPRPRREVDEGTRIRRYLTVMGSCLVLVVLAWAVVRHYSMPAALVMSAVAAVLPPVAVIIANYGVNLPSHGAGTGRTDGSVRPRDGGLED